MATPQEIQRIRFLINELDESNGWDDPRIDALLIDTANPDGSLDFRKAAQGGWEQKAAMVAELVNISENGSSRSSAQVFEHYMTMAREFGSGGSDDTGNDSLPRPMSNRIVRPTRRG